MKKQLIAIGILLMLFMIGLSGCTEENDSVGYLDSRFFGNWQNPVGVNLTFASNGSYYTEVVGWISTWEVKNEKVCYTFDDGTESCQDFSFSSDDNTLTLVAGGHAIVYTKID